MSTNRPTMQYPDEVQAKMTLPFIDKTCGQIIRELERRNWNVPGITCEFSTIGNGEDTHRIPFALKGDNFRLHFMPDRGSWCAIRHIVVPRLDFRFKESFDSEHTDDLELFVYAGSQWSEDKSRFISPAYDEADKVSSKQRGQKRWYLCYAGHFIGAGRYSQYLYHNDACGREYDLEPNDPVRYETEKVLEKIDQLLKTEVLQVILDQPLPKKQVDRFYEKTVAFPNTIGPLFCFGDATDAERIAIGRSNREALVPAHRYGFKRSDKLRVVGDGDGQLQTQYLNIGITHKPYGLGSITCTSSPEEIAIVGHNSRNLKGSFVFRVIPNRSNGVYITDQAPYIAACKAKYGDNLKAIDPKEFTGFPCRTIVPISTYTGGFEQPVVLIGRELDLDEVELVSGPWPSCDLASRICQHSDEANQLFQLAVRLYSSHTHKGDSQECVGYSDAVMALVAICKDSEQLTELGLQSLCHIITVVGDMVTARSLGLF